MKCCCLILWAAAIGACVAPRHEARDSGTVAFDEEFADESVTNPHVGRRSDERLAVRVRSAGLGARVLPECTFALSTAQLDEHDQSRGEARRAEFTRTKDRLHLVRDTARDPHVQDREEWMFERNPVALDELCAMRVDHGSRFLVDYTDGDLHLEGIAHGWASLAQGFVGVEELGELRRSGEKTTAYGIEFEKLLGDGEASGSIVEIDWSDTLGLPLRIVRRTSSGTIVQELVRLEFGASREAMRPFPLRWPDYRRKELSDWREDVHCHDQSKEHEH
jgi:hypothetical protein